MIRFDLRAHGESILERSGQQILPHELSREDFGQMQNDLYAVIEWAKSQNMNRFVLIGSGVGSLVILDYLCQHEIWPSYLITPTLVQSEFSFCQLKESPPIQALVSTDDPLGLDSYYLLKKNFPKMKKQEVYSLFVGADLLKKNPKLIPGISRWLNKIKGH